jgi:hypothetical protein
MQSEYDLMYKLGEIIKVSAHIWRNMIFVNPHVHMTDRKNSHTILCNSSIFSWWGYWTNIIDSYRTAVQSSSIISWKGN